MLEGKTLFELFPNYTEKEILKAFNKLTPKSKEVIELVFGKDLKNKANTQNLSQRRKDILYSTINRTLKRYLSKDNSSTKNNIPNNLIHETIKKIKYTPLTKEEETIYLKKLKLAYYYSVDDETKKLYLNYYCEVNPEFKEKYDKAKDEEKELLLNKAIEDAKKARKQFIKNNERLILIVIKKIIDNIPKEELFQEANIGLMTALEKFDVEAENKFSTYAIWWIKHSVNRYIVNNKETIRIPSNTYIKQLKIIQATDKLYKNLQRIPTAQEISIETNIPEKRVKEIQANMIYLIPKSLSEGIKEDSEDTLEELLQDQKSEFEEKIEQKLLIEKVKEIIKKLDNKSQIIINMRMGLNDGKNHTLDEVASCLGVTREAVRLAEIKILKKIRTELEHPLLNTSETNTQNDTHKRQNTIQKKENLRKTLLTEIALLDEKTRKLLELKYKYKLSDEEIEACLNITKKDLQKMEKQALLLIRERLNTNNKTR